MTKMCKISKPHPKVTVYDNVFSWNDQQFLYTECVRSPFALGWKDSTYQPEMFFHSEIPGEFYTNPPGNLGYFLQTLTNSKPFKDRKDVQIDKTVINCDTIADSHTHHIHKNQDVVLYYANLDWQDGWSGETLFYDDIGSEIICALPYTPNRMVVFDGELVHRFNGPSASAPKYRFSISTFFWKPEESV